MLHDILALSKKNKLKYMSRFDSMEIVPENKLKSVNMGDLNDEIKPNQWLLTSWICIQIDNHDIWHKHFSSSDDVVLKSS